jgi:predicted DCC family thiol-disulfide oxidoreductase YuxK
MAAAAGPDTCDHGGDGAVSTEPLAGWVLYDGGCGVCSRWVPFWAPTLRRIGLAVAPLQAPWVGERTGLSFDQLVQDLRLLHVDGRLTSGAAVYRYVMRRRWWAWPLYALSILPVGRQLFDWGYRTFARHRMQVSDVCGLAPADPRAPDAG